MFYAVSIVIPLEKLEVVFRDVVGCFHVLIGVIYPFVKLVY